MFFFRKVEKRIKIWVFENKKINVLRSLDFLHYLKENLLRKII